MSVAAPYVRRHIWGVLIAIAFLVVETLAELAQPALMAEVVDRGVANADVACVLRYGALMLGVAAAGAVGAVVRNNVSQRVAQSIGREMRDDLYAKVQTFSFLNIDRLQTAGIITRITNDVNAVVMFVGALMRVAVKMPLTCVGAIVLIVYHTPEFAPLMVAVVAAVAGLVALNMALSRPRFARLQATVDRLNAASREFIVSVRVVKAFGAEAREDARFADAAQAYCDAGIDARALPAVFAPLIALSVSLGTVVLLWVADLGDAGDIGRLLASVSYMAQLAQALGLINIIVNEAARAGVSSRRIAEVLDEKPAQTWVDAEKPAEPERPAASAEKPAGPATSAEPDEKLAAEPPAASAEPDEKLAAEPPAVAFDRVSFLYAGSLRPALEDVTFAVPQGATLGIIGPTGSGKSTLGSLVARFYDACEGTVALLGRDVTAVPQAELRAAVAVVPQESRLFAGTVAQNLRWGDADASDDALCRAARIAQAHAFVEKLPGGYDARLGQGGVNLSGGQRQRLCLARALLRRPRVLVLDDCTSALDGATEQAVLDGLAAHLEGAAVLLVSQRIATVRRADRILCLEAGRVQGLGTHEELLASCPTYRAIYESQIGPVPDPVPDPVLGPASAPALTLAFAPTLGREVRHG